MASRKLNHQRKKVRRRTPTCFALFFYFLNFAVTISDVHADEEKSRAFQLLGRKERCHSIPFEQTISVRGCANRTITNYRCDGQCYSAFAPSSSLTQCALCAPTRVVELPLTLQCGSHTKQFKVLTFRQCGCNHTSKCSFKGSQHFGASDFGSDASLRPCRSMCRQYRRRKRIYVRVKRERNRLANMLKTCCREGTMARFSPNKRSWTERALRGDYVKKKRKVKKLRKLMGKFQQQCEFCKFKKQEVRLISKKYRDPS